MRRVRVQRLSVTRFRTLTSRILLTLRDDDDAAGRLAERGWDAAATTAFQDAYDVFDEHVKRFRALRGERSAVSKQLQTETETFRRGRFRSHVQLTEWAVEETPGVSLPAALRDGVNVLRTPFPTWVTRASDFYHELKQSHLQAALAKVHFTPDEVQAGADTVDHLVSLYFRRNALSAERQQARRDRDVQRRVVEAQLQRLQSLAVPVFQTTPDHLEIFGFTVPS